MNDIPQVSVLIVTWNSAPYLPRCLDALSAQINRDFEVILIDNGSSDESLDAVVNRWPALKMRVERLGANKGFAAANNFGARLARGKWLALLNPDAFPEPDWLEELLSAAGNNPDYAFFASRQLQASDSQYLDGAGDAYHICGLAWRRFAGWPSAHYGLVAEEVFSPCAASALYARQAFLQVGGFDEDFFTYHEDVDLGFRLRLQGFRCLFVPKAVVHHIGSAALGAQSDFALYHWQRNFIWSFIQNMPSALLWEGLPSHLVANLIHLIHYMLSGRGTVMWKAKKDALLGLPHAFSKRRLIQKNLNVKRADLLRIMERNPLAPYLVGYFTRKIKRAMLTAK